MTTPTGKAPCDRVCEAQAFKIELRHMDSRIQERDQAIDVALEALESAIQTAEFEKHPKRPWHSEARDAVKLLKEVRQRVRLNANHVMHK